MLEIILLSLAVCTDAFAAACAYGVKGIKIKALPTLIISLTGAVFLGAALFTSTAVGELLPVALSGTLSATVLILIAMKNLSDSYVSDDDDLSSSLSLRGSLVTAAVLSADSVGAGFGAGLTMSAADKACACVLCFVLGMFSVLIGQITGRVCARKLNKYHTALMSAAVLFVLAVMKADQR